MIKNQPWIIKKPRTIVYFLAFNQQKLKPKKVYNNRMRTSIRKKRKDIERSNHFLVVSVFIFAKSNQAREAIKERKKR